MVLDSTSFIRHKGLNFDHMKLMVNSDALNMNSLFDSEPVGFQTSHHRRFLEVDSGDTPEWTPNSSSVPKKVMQDFGFEFF